VKASPSVTDESPVVASIHLRPGGDRRLRAGHPWVYSNEIRMDPEIKALPPGTVTMLHRVDGKPLGIGSFNPHALIAFRLFSPDPAITEIDRAFLAGRLAAAQALRERLFDAPYYRLVHGDADGLPGLVIDRYGDVLAVQTATAGMESLINPLLDALDSVIAPQAVVLSNDGAFRQIEKLDAYVRVAKGTVDGPLELREGSVRFLADLIGGQKTGWFFDQRDNRAAFAGLARGGRLLDVYCHGGGFAIAAAVAGGGTALGIDRSEPALELARQAADLNGVSEHCTFLRGDGFGELERLGAAGERFDMVAADPPAFVKTKKDLGPGLKAYEKLARLTAALVAPGGILFLASCSHNVSTERFGEAVAAGLRRAGRTGRIIRSGTAGPDHPVHPHLPESSYLKTLFLALD
jgi:23S rRNA (cytosine1962-C5)-methyltransferase